MVEIYAKNCIEGLGIELVGIYIKYKQCQLIIFFYLLNY